MYRNFLLTINNPKYDIHEFIERAKAQQFKYARAQLERGESGTPHIQGFIGGRQVRKTKVIKDWPGAHVEVARNALASWDYCGKQDTRQEGPVDFGVPPAQSNNKGDKKKRNALLLEMGVA